MSPPDGGIRVRVHEKDDRRVAAIVALTAQATRRRPLPARLEALCREVAAVLPADVASIYVRERDGDEEWLVMRGNVGLARGVVGNVRLRMGEGITGFAAECGRVVSVAEAPSEPSYHHVPGIGEERFPAFLAVPVTRDDRTEAVLVLQRRRADYFGPSEVALAAALAAPFALALTAAPASGARPRGHRAVRLAGTPVVEGTAVGIAHAAPTFEGLVAHDVTTCAGDVRKVLDGLSRSLLRAARALVGAGADSAAAAIEAVLHDERLVQVAVEECARHGAARGLREVARSYALTPYRLGLDGVEGAEWLEARAREVEQLCLLAAAELVGAEPLEAGSVLLLPEPPGTLLALAARAYGVVGVAVGAELDPDDPAIELLWRADIPTIGEVAGVFDWVRPGDRVLVDGATGTLRTDPPPADLLRLRTGLA